MIFNYKKVGVFLIFDIISKSNFSNLLIYFHLLLSFHKCMIQTLPYRHSNQKGLNNKTKGAYEHMRDTPIQTQSTRTPYDIPWEEINTPNTAICVCKRFFEVQQHMKNYSHVNWIKIVCPTYTKQDYTRTKAEGMIIITRIGLVIYKWI